MQDWKKWRSEGLGASDSPAIMGVSPWKTRYQLWEEKAGLVVPDDQGNWATKRGNELEPKARAHYELTYGIEMPIAFVEHKTYPFIRASLDGYNEAQSIVLEIKCPGKDDHDLAKQGKVPEKYYPQLQHQLLASGAAKVHYYSFDEVSAHLVEVLPNAEYCQKLLNELIIFWGMVQTKQAPELEDRDFKKVKDIEAIALLARWNDTKREIENLEEQESDLREKILEKLGHHSRWKHDSTTIYKAFRKGTIDYAKIPEIKNLDLEQYRKKGSETWTFRREK